MTRVAMAVALLVAACGAPTAPSSSGETGLPAESVPPVSSPCAIEPQEGRLPSDRLVDVVVEGGVGGDRIVFVFAPQAGFVPPTGRLREVHPPFSAGASGLPVEVEGPRFVELRFDGQTIMTDTGQPVYEGDSRFTPRLTAIREAVILEAFEGVVVWVVGFQGAGCVRLTQAAGGSVSLEISHG